MPTPALSLVDVKNLNPALLLKRISNYAKVGLDGRVSYVGGGYFEDMALLHGMFRFDHHVSQAIARASINQAVGVCIREKKLTSDNLLGTAKRLYADAIESDQKAYFLLSELSITSSILIGSFSVGNAKVRILRSSFPKKFGCRRKYADDYQRESFEHNPESYQKVIATVEAGSAEVGFQIGMDAIDVVRALFSTDVNLVMEMQLGGERFIPINKITPGGLHTLHKSDGTSAYDGFWYEPLVRFRQPHRIKQDRELKVLKKAKKILGILNKAKDREFALHLMRSLTRYVRAFDEPDPSNCLLKGWTALEQLVGEDAHGDSERVVRRVSFLFADFSNMELMLNVIKHARNDIAHRGSGRPNLRTYCYQIQSCFVQTFRVYLGALRRGRSKKDIDQLLDLPADVAHMKAELYVVEARKVLLRSGLKFRNSS